MHYINVEEAIDNYRNNNKIKGSNILSTLLNRAIAEHNSAAMKFIEKERNKINFDFAVVRICSEINCKVHDKQTCVSTDWSDIWNELNVVPNEDAIKYVIDTLGEEPFNIVAVKQDNTLVCKRIK